MLQITMQKEFDVECIFAVVGPETLEEQNRRCGIEFDVNSDGIIMQMSKMAQSFLHDDKSVLNGLLNSFNLVQEKQFSVSQGKDLHIISDQ